MTAGTTIPERLTSGTLPRILAEPDSRHMHIKLGPSLTREAVEYFDESLKGWELAQRVLQLEQLDARLARTYRLYDAGLSSMQIAERLEVSRRHAQRLTMAALNFLFGDRRGHVPAEEEARLFSLAVRNRKAWEAFALSRAGYSQEQIAETLGISVRSVQRFVALARDTVGDLSPSVLRLLAQLGAGETRRLSPIAADDLARENERLHGQQRREFDA